MIIAVYSILISVCVILGVLYCIFKYENNIINISLKTLPVLACLILALVSANLSSNYGAFTLLVTIAIAVLLPFETVKCVNQEKKFDKNGLFLSITNFVGVILFSVAGLSLITFTPWGMLAGLLFGLGSSCLFMLLSKGRKWTYYLGITLTFTANFVFIFQAIATIMFSKALLLSILYLTSAILMTAHSYCGIFSSRNRVMYVISDAFRVLSLIAIASTIFLG